MQTLKCHQFAWKYMVPDFYLLNLVTVLPIVLFFLSMLRNMFSMFGDVVGTAKLHLLVRPLKCQCMTPGAFRCITSS